MGCGCGGKPWEPPKDGQAPVSGTGAGPANPAFTWPPRGNGPKPKAS